MNINKEFVREIKINKKKRLKYNVITLIFLNFLFMLSLVYMFLHVRNIVSIIVAIVLLIGCLIGSARTILNTKDNRKYLVYRDKISIRSSSFNNDILLKNVYFVKPKKNIVETIFKRDAHMITLSIKTNMRELVVLPFIDEDTAYLADELMELAISARARENRVSATGLIANRMINTGKKKSRTRTNKNSKAKQKAKVENANKSVKMQTNKLKTENKKQQANKTDIITNKTKK